MLHACSRCIFSSFSTIDHVELLNSLSSIEHIVWSCTLIEVEEYRIFGNARRFAEEVEHWTQCASMRNSQMQQTQRVDLSRCSRLCSEAILVS